MRTIPSVVLRNILLKDLSRGDVALVSPHENGTRWALEQIYSKNHSEIVRCALWDEKNGVLLTGGEDAKINIWSSPVSVRESPPNRPSMDSPSRKRIDSSNDQIVRHFPLFTLLSAEASI